MDKPIISHDHLGHHHGQDDFRAVAVRNGQTIGTIDYTISQGEITVKHVNVPEEFRRQGIATNLYDSVLQEHPEHTLGRSMLTPEGSLLRKSIDQKYGDRITPVKPKTEKPIEFSEKEWDSVLSANKSAEGSGKEEIAKLMEKMNDFDNGIRGWQEGDDAGEMISKYGLTERPTIPPHILEPEKLAQAQSDVPDLFPQLQQSWDQPPESAPDSPDTASSPPGPVNPMSGLDGLHEALNDALNEMRGILVGQEPGEPTSQGTTSSIAPPSLPGTQPHETALDSTPSAVPPSADLPATPPPREPEMPELPNPVGMIEGALGQKEPWAMKPEEFVSGTEYSRQVNEHNAATKEFDRHDRLVPGQNPPPSFPSPELGSWRLDENTGVIAQLKEYDPNDLKYTEPDVERRGGSVRDDAKTYAGWRDMGLEPPPVEVLETLEGSHDVFQGHRRTEAARMSGQPIKAWTHKEVDAGKDERDKPVRGMAQTREDAVRAAAASGKQIRPEIAATVPGLDTVDVPALPAPIPTETERADGEDGKPEAPRMPEWEPPELPDMAKQGRALAGVDTDPLLPGYQNQALADPASVDWQAELVEMIGEAARGMDPAAGKEYDVGPGLGKPGMATLPGETPPFQTLAREGLPGGAGTPGETTGADWQGAAMGGKGEELGETIRELIKAMGELRDAVREIQRGENLGGVKRHGSDW